MIKNINIKLHINGKLTEDNLKAYISKEIIKFNYAECLTEINLNNKTMNRKNKDYIININFLQNECVITELNTQKNFYVTIQTNQFLYKDNKLSIEYINKDNNELIKLEVEE